VLLRYFGSAQKDFGGIMKKILILLVVLLATVSAIPAFAAQLRVYVSEINASSVPNKDEMKLMLQTLLASRLNSASTTTVGTAAEADIIVGGSYISIGKIFSIDVQAKNAAGKVLTRAYEQGENQDDLIPAVGKLADKLSVELLKSTPAISPVITTNMIAPGSSDILKGEQKLRTPVTGGEFIKPPQQHNVTGDWVSKRLDGATNLLAIGKSLPDGTRDVFLAENHRLAYYRQNTDMQLITEAVLKTTEKIISLDTVENSDGAVDIYVTIIRSDELASQVWQLNGDKLVQLANNLPYFFRSFSLAGAPKKLYSQSMGRESDFYGEVSEATRVGSNIVLNNPIKMPRYANIYSFNQFQDRDGKKLTIVINPDNHLIVYNQDSNELWRSNDKFGGSELFFQKEDADVRVTGDKFRWIFLNQRVQVTSKGEIITGKNDGFWVLGNARTYKRGAVYSMAWNGSSLEEKWHTRDTQNYMADYYFDESRNELLILQTVQRPGFTSSGASSLSIKKVE
jgi:hypothetical protein